MLLSGTIILYTSVYNNTIYSSNGNNPNIIVYFYMLSVLCTVLLLLYDYTGEYY